MKPFILALPVDVVVMTRHKSACPSLSTRTMSRQWETTAGGLSSIKKFAHRCCPGWTQSVRFYNTRIGLNNQSMAREVGLSSRNRREHDKDKNSFNKSGVGVCRNSSSTTSTTMTNNNFTGVLYSTAFCRAFTSELMTISISLVMYYPTATDCARQTRRSRLGHSPHRLFPNSKPRCSRCFADTAMPFTMTIDGQTTMDFTYSFYSDCYAKLVSNRSPRGDGRGHRYKRTR